MTEVSRLSTSEEYTAAMAVGVAGVLRSGDVVALVGELGAGKTTFARSMAQALGVARGLVSSPTFVFMNVYPAERGAAVGASKDATRGRAVERVVHVDAYRLTSTEDLDALGWDQYFDPHTRAAVAGTVAMIEWPARIGGALPEEALRVEFVQRGEHEREIVLHVPESWRSREGVEWLIDREPTRCPTTGGWVSPTAATYPFANERARDADLFKWFAGQHVVSRPVKEDDDLAEGVGGDAESG